MIRHDVQDAVAQILLDSPPVNGITLELLDALMSHLRQAGSDADVRAIVIGSTIPGRFCGGLDLPKIPRKLALAGPCDRAQTLLRVVRAAIQPAEAGDRRRHRRIALQSSPRGISAFSAIFGRLA